MTNQTPADLATQNQEIDWWNDADADAVEGFDLIKDAALFSLVGVPFRITKLTFHDGIQQDGCAYRNDFASAELRVAPYHLGGKPALDRIMSRRTGKLIGDKEGIPLPDEFLVINDGSTGAYRQFVQYLEAKGLIELPEHTADEEVGGKNESVYDLPRSEWVSGAETATAGIEVKLNCPRGLRYSDYDNTFGPKGERAITWYLA